LAQFYRAAQSRQARNFDPAALTLRAMRSGAVKLHPHVRPRCRTPRMMRPQRLTAAKIV